MSIIEYSTEYNNNIWKTKTFENIVWSIMGICNEGSAVLSCLATN